MNVICILDRAQCTVIRKMPSSIGCPRTPSSHASSSFPEINMNLNLAFHIFFQFKKSILLHINTSVNMYFCIFVNIKNKN